MGYRLRQIATQTHVVDNRCYQAPSDWGKLGEGHSRLIVDEIVSLPEGGDYKVLHLGCGNTYSPVPGRGVGHTNWPISFDGWLRSVYYTQFSEETFPHPRDGHPHGILVKRVNYTLSDSNFEQLSELVKFRSEICFLDPDHQGESISGKQEYRKIDATDIPYNRGEIDIVIAVGFFSKKVLTDENVEKILAEISRVLKPGGKLVSSVHENYVEHLVRASKTIGFELEKCEVGKDLGPENSENIGTRSLLVLSNN